MSSLGSRIKENRLRAKLTQKNVASLLKVDNTTVSKWESDTYEPDVSTLKELADLFNITTDKLLYPHPKNLADVHNNTIDLVDRMFNAVNKAQQGEGVAEQIAAFDADPLKDPELNLFFKDFASAPEQMKKEMLQFWNFIKDKEKNRKPGDIQGE